MLPIQRWKRILWTYEISVLTIHAFAKCLHNQFSLFRVAFDARFNQNLSEIELRCNLIGILFSGCLILFTLCYMRIGNILKLSIFTKIIFVKICNFLQLQNTRISFLLVFNWWKIYFINHCTSELIFYFIRSHFYNKRYCLFDHRLNIKKNFNKIFLYFVIFFLLTLF